MKLLLTLLVCWLSLTFVLAFNNLKYQSDAEDQVNRRLLLVYGYTVTGCMLGAEYVNFSYDFVTVMSKCIELGYRERDIYFKTQGEIK